MGFGLGARDGARSNILTTLDEKGGINALDFNRMCPTNPLIKTAGRAGAATKNEKLSGVAFVLIVKLPYVLLPVDIRFGV